MKPLEDVALAAKVDDPRDMRITLLGDAGARLRTTLLLPPASQNVMTSPVSGLTGAAFARLPGDTPRPALG